MQKMISNGISTHRNTASLTSPERFYDVQEAGVKLSEPFVYMKHPFREIAHVAFFNARKVEINFGWPFDTV
jgi:hypothetical protein